MAHVLARLNPDGVLENELREVAAHTVPEIIA